MPLALRNSAIPLVPLSEDEPLLLVGFVREVVVESGQRELQSEVTAIAPGEKRAVGVSVRVKRDAHGEMVRMFTVPAGSRLVIDHAIELDPGASWRGTIIVRGEGEVSIRRVLHVFGPGASAEFNVIADLSGSGRISVAEEMFGDHADCKLAVRTRLVLNDATTGFLRARLVVGEHAVRMTASEDLHALVFDDRVTTRIIPELEVRQSDVQCRHAASRMTPDLAQVWYLQSRGLDSVQIRQQLARAFYQNILERLPGELQTQAERVLTVDRV